MRNQVSKFCTSEILPFPALTFHQHLAGRLRGPSLQLQHADGRALVPGAMAEGSCCFSKHCQNFLRTVFHQRHLPKRSPKAECKRPLHPSGSDRAFCSKHWQEQPGNKLISSVWGKAHSIQSEPTLTLHGDQQTRITDVTHDLLCFGGLFFGFVFKSRKQLVRRC